MIPRHQPSFLSVIVAVAIGNLSACGGNNSDKPACRPFASHYTVATETINKATATAQGSTTTTKAAFDRAALTMRYQNYDGDADASDPVLKSTTEATWDTIDHAVVSNRPLGKDTSVRIVMKSTVTVPVPMDCILTFDRKYDSMGRITDIVGSPYVEGCAIPQTAAYSEWDAVGRPTKGNVSSGLCQQQSVTKVYDDLAQTITTTYAEAPSCTHYVSTSTYDPDALPVSQSNDYDTAMVLVTYTTLEKSEICQ